MKQSPNYKVYAETAPRPQDWPLLLTKLCEFLRTDYDWSNEVALIRSPVLLVYGDSDAVHLEHMIELFTILGGRKQNLETSKARLAILPSLTHYDILTSPELRSIVNSFLDSPERQK